MSMICLLSPAQIWVNPRVRKEADTLADAGHDVVVGYRADGDVERDDAVLAGRPWRWCRIDVGRRREPARWLATRIRQRGAQLAWRAGLQSGRVARAAYCTADDQLLQWAIAQPADLYVAHTQPVLAVAAAAAAHRHVPYAFDCEDLLAEEAADGGRARWRRTLIVSLEQRFLPDAAYVSCTSTPMADYLSTTYGLRRVHVWPNCFPISERVGVAAPCDRPSVSPVEVAWLSATIGPGRGLEDGLSAMAHLAPRASLHIYGGIAPDAGRWVQRYLSPLLAQRLVVVHPPVAADRIVSTIARHQIGLSLDGNDGLNRSLTVANKFFYYLQAGLACVAADTAGHRSVMPAGARYGILYPPGDVRALAAALQHLLVPDALLAAQRAAWDAGGGTYSWERYRPKLLTTVSATIATQAPARSEGPRAAALA
jgi:glycosyltransferase involved in cell wall biosynthesis